MIFKGLVVMFLLGVKLIYAQDCEDLQTICSASYMDICREQLMQKALQANYNETEAKRLLMVIKVLHDVVGVHCEARIGGTDMVALAIKGIIGFALVSKDGICSAAVAVGQAFTNVIAKIGIKAPNWEKVKRFKRFVCDGMVDSAKDPANPTTEELANFIQVTEEMGLVQGEEMNSANVHSKRALTTTLLIVLGIVAILH